MTRLLMCSAGAIVSLALAAPADAAQTITGRGVGGVRLGALYSTLHARGLVGPIGPGCEFAGPQARSARLRPPLLGSVDFSMSEPRRVRTITIRGGAMAHGIHVGSTAGALRRAFPGARFDHGSDQTFGATFVTACAYGGTIGFAVSTTTQRVEQIAVPQIAACD